MHKIKTASGTTIILNGPTEYVRVAGGQPQKHTCLLWGALVPAPDGHVNGLLLAAMVETGAGPRILPVAVSVGKVVPCAPLGFFVTGPDGLLRMHVSTPVAEVDGVMATPEGPATELPDWLQKALGEEV